MNKDTLKESEKENLKKMVGGYCWYQDGGNGGYSFEEVLNYIETLIEQTRKEERERCISIIEPYWDEAPVDEVINKIKFND